MPWVNGRWQGGQPLLQDVAGDKPECSCCEASGVPLELYSTDPGSRTYDDAKRDGRPPYKALCRLCASTHVGIYYDYPDQHDHDALAVMRMVSFVGNEILKELRRRP